MMRYAILSNWLSLLMKTKADGVGCSSGQPRRWEVSKRATERERCWPERAHKWLNVIGSHGHVTEENKSKILPPWFVSRTNIDLSGRLINRCYECNHFFFNSNDIKLFASPTVLPYVQKCDWTSNVLRQISAIRSPPRHIHNLRKTGLETRTSTFTWTLTLHVPHAHNLNN